MGDRPFVPDGSVAGGHPARLERRHSRLPLGREGDGDDDGLLGTARLCRDRASPRRSWTAPRRRREPRQPALGRSRSLHPHGEPDGRGEEGESGLPGLPRQRLQRDAGLRAPLLGGRPRDLRLEPRQAAGRAAAGSPRRLLPADAGRDVRLRARPDRLRRPPGHDEGPSRDLRDVLELRRGRASLGPRTVGHARGAAEARPAVRPDRGSPHLRAAAVRARDPLRPRPDAGLDVQAAQRLRARRARRALALPRQRRGHVRRRRATVDGRPCARRGDRHGGQEGEEEEERRLRSGRRRDGLGQPRSRST